MFFNPQLPRVLFVHQVRSVAILYEYETQATFDKVHIIIPEVCFSLSLSKSADLGLCCIIFLVLARKSIALLSIRNGFRRPAMKKEKVNNSMKYKSCNLVPVAAAIGISLTILSTDTN